MNMYKTLKLSLAIVLMGLTALTVIAQDEAYSSFSPYSMFGIGDILRQGTSTSKSMAGIGIASRDPRALNVMNPAAVTKRETKSVMADFGLFSENKIYKQYDIKSSNNTFNMSNLMISFPVYKSFAIYAGFQPFSSLGYEVTSYSTDKTIIENTGGLAYTSTGSGGLNMVFVGGGIDVFKGLSVGAEMDYYFGNIDKENSLESENSNMRDLYSGYNIRLHTFGGKFGAQYELQMKNSMTAVIGATYRLKTNFKGNVKDIEYASISSINDTTRNETTSISGNNVKMASEIGVGFSLKKADKWMAEIDYLRSDWSDCGLDMNGFANVGDAVFSATASQSLRAGFSLVPNRNDIRYYMKTVTYRAGAYWEQAYYKLDGNTINSFGLTFGATFPVFKWSNGLSVGVDIGQRGSLSGSKVRERYVNFTLGINIFDIWFIKPHYD